MKSEKEIRLKTTPYKVGVYTFLFLILAYLPVALGNSITTNKSITPSHTTELNPLAKIIPAYSATYTVYHKSSPAGTAVRELQYIDNKRVNYRYETHVKWFIFSQTRKESSVINTQNPEIITPLSYDNTRTGTGKDKKYKWRFDSKTNQGFDLGRDRVIPLDFKLPLQDKLSYHLQHRINLINDASQASYNYSVMSTSGSVRNHLYVFDGTEALTLPYGVVNAIRLKREVKEKERITYAWFAPELNYLMVKLYQIKEGSEQFEAQLKHLETSDTGHIKPTH